MTIEEALHLCDVGKILIRVSSMREKQTLIDICHEYGYDTGGCTAVSYQEYPLLGNDFGKPLDDQEGKLSFWRRPGHFEVTTLSELSTDQDIDSAFVSNLL